MASTPVEKRLPWNEESPLTFECPYCPAIGKSTYLKAWYNGGELDSGKCPQCGARYYGEHVKTELVIQAPNRTPEEGGS